MWVAQWYKPPIPRDSAYHNHTTNGDDLELPLDIRARQEHLWKRRFIADKIIYRQNMKKVIYQLIPMYMIIYGIW